MKHQKKIYYIILVFITLVGMWMIPSLVRKATYTPDSYPFVYYSSMLKELGIIDYKDKKTPLTDLEGNKYTTAQFDSLMPLLNYRQLMADGRLPDSIGGYEITPPLLRSKTVVFKYNPAEMQTPDPGLYILFESMPKRVGLEMPEDVFRMKDRIEFIDANTNTVNEEKSALFQQALDKEGYNFPSVLLAGNPNPRKPYDEGYFSIDAENNLFHMKMVNGRPYVRNTHVGDSINIAYFSILEVSDKRFYGFLFSKEGNVYIVEGVDGKYKPLQLDIPSVDLRHDQVTIMGNLLYWTVSVTTPEGRNYYGLKTETLEKVAEHTINRQDNKWDKVSKWLFPYYLTLQQTSSDYIFPLIHFISIWGFCLNALLSLSLLLISRSTKKRIFNSLYVLFTGIAGFIAILLLPKFRKD